MTAKRIVLAAALIAGVAGSAPAAASDYILVRKQIRVERPADVTWQRIGSSFCGIGDWLKLKCVLLAGTGDVGSVRQLNGEIEEPMVGRTERSYTYAQTKGAMTGFEYHGTLAVEPAGKNAATIIYTITYDAALMPSDDVRKAQYDRIGPRFQSAIEAMKALVEAKK